MAIDNYNKKIINNDENSTSEKSSEPERLKTFLLRVAFFILIVSLAGLLNIFIYDFITQGYFFSADNIVVDGNKKLVKDEILSRAGINIGTNIYGVNLSLAEKKLTSHPWIERAFVERRKPSTIVIEIEEQQSIAVLDIGTRFLINNKGLLFKKWEEGDPENIPVISGLNVSDVIYQNGNWNISEKSPLEILKISKAYDSALFNKFINVIKIDKETGLTLYALDFIEEIKLGFDDFDRKLRKIKSIQDNYLRKKSNESLRIESIDLNNINRVVVRFSKV